MELTAPAAVGRRSRCASTGVRGGLGPRRGQSRTGDLRAGGAARCAQLPGHEGERFVRPSSSTWPGWPSSGAHGGAPPRLPGRALLPQRRLESAAPLAVARLDDALLLLDGAVA